MHCLDCGYDLHGLTEHRCPECGRGFDPKDKKTYGTKINFRYARLARIMGKLLAVITALVTLSAIASSAMGHGLTNTIAIWAYGLIPFLAVGFAWLGCIYASRHPPSKRVYAVGAGLLMLNASLINDWPMDIAFRLHQNALTQHAQQTHSNQFYSGTKRVGIYQLRSVGFTSYPSGQYALIFSLHGDVSGPVFIVYGMTDKEIEKNFNLWSYRRLNQDWHIVREE